MRITFTVEDEDGEFTTAIRAAVKKEFEDQAKNIARRGVDKVFNEESDERVTRNIRNYIQGYMLVDKVKSILGQAVEAEVAKGVGECRTVVAKELAIAKNELNLEVNAVFKAKLQSLTG